MAEYQSVFKRYELKYRLKDENYKRFTEAISEYMEIDCYGKTTICSLYFDTDDYRLIRASIEKPVYKEKLRLRTYGVPEENGGAFVELKKKYKGVVYKRRLQMPYGEAYGWLCGEKEPPDSQVGAEIQQFINFYGGLKPMAALFYDRVSYFGKDDRKLRVTIDENVRFRTENTGLVNGDEGTRVFGDGEYIMEIKIHGAMPIWLSKILDELKIYPQSCSKYGTAYELMLRNQYAKGVITK